MRFNELLATLQNLKPNEEIDHIYIGKLLNYDSKSMYSKKTQNYNLYYGQVTKRQPACVLIMERGKKDLKYLKRLRKAAYKKGIRTFTITPEHLINKTLRLPQTNNKCK